jgi:uncharacterized protein (DUF1501 family)
MKRRDFIKNSALGAVIPGLFGQYGVSAVALSPWLQKVVNATAETDHVLVIIRLNGGNDSLNMVIPLDQYKNLTEARANIIQDEAKVLRLNDVDGTGLHPAMTGLQALYNEGKLRIIQGVGYPNQNFSHFRSTDIYMSASESNEQLSSGWVGRYLANEYPNYPAGYPNATMPDPLAIQINDMTLTLQGPSTVMGVTVSDPNNPYKFLDDSSNPLTGNPGAEMTFLRSIAKQADRYGSGIQSAFVKAGANMVTYPAGVNLADQLKIVARLIRGGLKTRVYMVQIGGFDTHSNQVDATNKSIGSHANLMKSLSDSITAFQRDIEAMKLQDRVLGMTFSEFGRRVRSNASTGTDHGAAYSSFVFGKSVLGGMTGKNPDIPANAPQNTNLPMQFDFRSIYASILKDWFCVDEMDLQATMLRNFQPLKIINPTGCLPVSVHEQNVAAGQKLIGNYPNPFTTNTTIEFETFGDFAMVQVFDGEGVLLDTLAEGDLPEGKHKVTFDGSMLPAGIYYARLQNGVISQMRTMLKVN